MLADLCRKLGRKVLGRTPDKPFAECLQRRLNGALCVST